MKEDIDDLQKQVRRLEEEIEHLRQKSEHDLAHRLVLIINHIPLAIVSTRSDGVITAVNNAFLRNFGVDETAIVRKTNILEFEPFLQNPIQPHIVELLSHGLEFDHELLFRLNNKEVYYRCRGIQVSSQISDEVNYLVIIGDVTRRKLTELELVKALEKAEESDRLKTAFLAAMSHEIRTPMNHIIGFTEFLKDPKLDQAEREEYCQIISQSGQDLLRLIEDIIDIARIESHQMIINPSVIDVVAFMSSIFNTFYQQLSTKKSSSVAFLFRAPANAENLYIMTDAIRLHQIINNLLENAFKFTSEGEVELGYEVHNNKLMVYVRDTGPGIPPDKQEWIFKPFRQLDYSISKKFGGVGLGLALVKKLVELLKGEVHLKSEPNQGALFTVIIPGFVMEESNRQKNGHSGYDWSKYTFFVVEDERSNYNLLSIMLRPSKANLIWARDGNEAIEKFDKYKDEIHLVLMDIRLPGINGYEVTRYIKQIRPNLPVIAQTAYAMEIEIIKAREVGCDDYITKPIDRRLLLDMIARHLPPAE